MLNIFTLCSLSSGNEEIRADCFNINTNDTDTAFTSAQLSLHDESENMQHLLTSVW